MIAYWYVLPVLAMYALCAVLSKQNAEHQGLWTLWVAVAGWIPLWAIVSRYSRNLLFDGMLYDILMFLGYAGTMILLGGAQRFTVSQWAGTALVVVGFILMRVRL